MRKEYTINELATILGCSRTAVTKKIKPDKDNPVLKRYRERYEVSVINGQITILMDDDDLEREKKLSKGFNTQSVNTHNTAEESEVIDVEPVNEKENLNTVISLTERYTNQLITLQEKMYNEIQERDKQILLLTTSEKTKEDEYIRTQAENKTLKMRNRVLTVILGVVITLCVIGVTVYVTYNTLQNTLKQPEAENKPQEIQTIVLPADNNKKLPNKKR